MYLFFTRQNKQNIPPPRELSTAASARAPAVPPVHQAKPREKSLYMYSDVAVPISVEKLIWAFMQANYYEELTKIINQHHLNITETFDENPLDIVLKFCGGGCEAEKGINAFLSLYSDVASCTTMGTAVDMDPRLVDRLARKYNIVVQNLGNHRYGLIGTNGVRKLSAPK